MSVISWPGRRIPLLLAVLAASFGCGSTKNEFRSIADGGTGGMSDAGGTASADGGAGADRARAEGGEAGSAAPP